MKKLNSKYVESVVKKAADGKIVAVHKEKKSGTRSKSRKGKRRGAKKRKIGRPTWKPGPNQPW